MRVKYRRLKKFRTFREPIRIQCFYELKQVCYKNFIQVSHFLSSTSRNGNRGLTSIFKAVLGKATVASEKGRVLFAGISFEVGKRRITTAVGGSGLLTYMETLRFFLDGS